MDQQIVTLARTARQLVTRFRMLVLLAGILLANIVPVFAYPAAAAAGADYLAVNERLGAGQLLLSRSGQYQVEMQNDGNLVIYANPGHVFRWQLGTRTRIAGQVFLGNQNDGNLVMYDTSDPNRYIAIWSTGTSGANTLVMQDDGNLVLYTNTVPRVALWASDTASSSSTSLASRIRDNGRIALDTVHVSGVRDNANARQNIVDTANGLKAARSCYGTAPCGYVTLDPRMLQGMLTLSETYTLRISEIAGGSHSSGSLHYAGVAFDVSAINGVGMSSKNPYYGALMQRCRNLGAIEVLGPGSPGHDTHVHCAWSRP